MTNIDTLNELITNGACVVDFLDKNKQFTEDLVVVNSSLLSKRFIQSSFNIDTVKEFFTEDAWTAVKQLYTNKINQCTCSVCSDICIIKSISCEICNSWWHIDCYVPKITPYYLKKETWSCSDCRFTVTKKSQKKVTSTQMVKNMTTGGSGVKKTG